MDAARQRTALITGITGQDGSYLAECLLAKGYRVFGTGRGGNPARTAPEDTNRAEQDPEMSITLPENDQSTPRAGATEIDAA